MLTLLDLGSKVNLIYPIFAEKLGFMVQTINICAQKIDGTIFETYGLVVADFSITDQADRIKFFEETFLVANISLDVVLGMRFFILNNVDVDFLKRKLWWRSYTIKKALPTTKQVKLIRKKEFAALVLDPGYETFIVYVASLKSPSNTQEGDVYPFCKAQIAALVANEVLISISTKYSDFADVFSPELASKLLEYTGITDHAIKLVNDWQPPYGPINSLRPVELETLKTYIEINLANSFIRLSKSLAEALILFDKKPDGSLQLCVDYWGLNNPIIKN